MSEGNYNYLFKFIIIGDTYVGKSNILSRYTYNRFNTEHEVTIGCEFMSKNVECQDRVVRVQIWDTAGQEAFRSITRSYYKNSTCALIVYDVTNKSTFQNVTSWVNECREMSSKDILMLLIGNKTDLEDKRVVTEKEGKDFADENGLFFFETSALNGSQVEEAFTFAIGELVKRLESGTMQIDVNASGIKIGKYPNKQIEDILEKKKSGCC